MNGKALKEAGNGSEGGVVANGQGDGAARYEFCFLRWGNGVE